MAFHQGIIKQQMIFDFSLMAMPKQQYLKCFVSQQTVSFRYGTADEC